MASKNKGTGKGRNKDEVPTDPTQDITCGDDMSIACPSSVDGDTSLLMFTCDPSRLSEALEYEQLFCYNLPKLKTELETFGTERDDSGWWPTWGGVTGVQMYFWKPGVESIARMLLLAHDQGLTEHAAKYKQCLMDLLDYIVPLALSGDGTIGFSGGVSEYQFDGTRPIPHERHAYLSMTRFMAFSGYAVEAMRKCGVSAADEAKFQDWAVQMEAPIQRFMDNMAAHCDPTNAGFAHMCTHPMVAACYWSEIGTYSFDADIVPALNSVLTEYAATNYNIGSDIGHDTDTMSNISMLREKQLCGGATALPVITDDIIGAMGDSAATRILSGETWDGATGLSPEVMNLFALSKAFSPTVASEVGPALLTEYPNLANNTTSNIVFNHFTSVASAAYGCAAASDNEVC